MKNGIDAASQTDSSYLKEEAEKKKLAETARQKELIFGKKVYWDHFFAPKSPRNFIQSPSNSESENEVSDESILADDFVLMEP